MSKNSTFTRTQAILLAKVAEMSQDTKAAAENGLITIEDGLYFKRADISGKSNMFDVLKNDDSIKEGFCNISKQKIDQGKNLAIDRISVMIATTTTSGATAGTVKYGKVLDSNDPAVTNAELEIFIKKVRVFSAPLSQFTQEIKDGHSLGTNINLDAPKLVTDADELQFRVKFPDGAVVDTTSSAKTFIEVLIAGSMISND